MGLELRLRASILSDRVRWAVLGVPLVPDHVAGDAERDSPRDCLEFEVGGRAALLCYGRPSARGRPVFGELVPYGRLWRTGANEPTILQMPFAARVAGIRVPRGKYSIYTIPTPDAWQVVVNRSTRQSGRTREEVGKRGNRFPNAYTDAVRAAEVGRAPIEARTIEHVERLTARAEPSGARETVLIIEWERTQLRLPIRV